MNSSAHNPTIAAVVVTHNRLALLQECIAALRAQTRQLDEIIVVNNASTDGTPDWLAQQADLTMIHQENLGSSGGQYTGIKTACQKGHDWIWCMDDDTVPNADALEKMTVCPAFAAEDTGFLASLVTWTDGKLYTWCNPVSPSHSHDWCLTVLTDKTVRVTLSTFVSLLVSRRAVMKVGLPVKSFFIIYDDVEYTRRISAHFKNFCILDSVVVHKIKSPASQPDFSNPFVVTKYCYGIRNEFAYIRLDPLMGRWGKLLGILNSTYVYTRMILTRRIPRRAALFILRGLFYRPAIEKIDDAADDTHHALAKRPSLSRSE